MHCPAGGVFFFSIILSESSVSSLRRIFKKVKEVIVGRKYKKKKQLSDYVLFLLANIPVIICQIMCLFYFSSLWLSLSEVCFFGGSRDSDAFKLKI